MRLARRSMRGTSTTGFRALPGSVVASMARPGWLLVREDILPRIPEVPRGVTVWRMNGYLVVDASGVRAVESMYGDVYSWLAEAAGGRVGQAPGLEEEVAQAFASFTPKGFRSRVGGGLVIVEGPAGRVWARISTVVSLASRMPVTMTPAMAARQAVFETLYRMLEAVSPPELHVPRLHTAKIIPLPPPVVIRFSGEKAWVYSRGATVVPARIAASSYAYFLPARLASKAITPVVDAPGIRAGPDAHGRVLAITGGRVEDPSQGLLSVVERLAALGLSMRARRVVVDTGRGVVDTFILEPFVKKAGEAYLSVATVSRGVHAVVECRDASCRATGDYYDMSASVALYRFAKNRGLPRSVLELARMMLPDPGRLLAEVVDAIPVHWLPRAIQGELQVPGNGLFPYKCYVVGVGKRPPRAHRPAGMDMSEWERIKRQLFNSLGETDVKDIGGMAIGEKSSVYLAYTC